MQLVVFYLIALLIGVGGDGLIWRAQDIELGSITSMTGSVSTLVAFMVGLCVSAALARWWQMRDACLGGLWGCIDDLCLIAGTIFADDVDHIRTQDMPEFCQDKHSRGRASPSPGRADSTQFERAVQDRNLHDKERLLRLGLASVALTFMQARGETSLDHLSQLVARKLITPREFRILSRHMSKAPGQVCWCWIAHMFTIAAAEGRLGQQKLWYLHSRCAEARGCIGRTFAYIDTQLPLAYIHLLALLVKLTLFVMAIEAGATLAVFLEKVCAH